MGHALWSHKAGSKRGDLRVLPTEGNGGPGLAAQDGTPWRSLTGHPPGTWLLEQGSSTTSHSLQHKKKKLPGNAVMGRTTLSCHRTAHIDVQAEFEHPGSTYHLQPSACTTFILLRVSWYGTGEASISSAQSPGDEMVFHPTARQGHPREPPNHRLPSAQTPKRGSYQIVISQSAM